MGRLFEHLGRKVGCRGNTVIYPVLLAQFSKLAHDPRRTRRGDTRSLFENCQLVPLPLFGSTFVSRNKSISSAASKDETSGGVTNYFASNEGRGAAKNQKCPEIPEAKFVRMSLGTFKREGNCCRRRSEKLGARLHSKKWQRTLKVLAPSCDKLLPLEVQLSL